jgi:hypothetical protein
MRAEKKKEKKKKKKKMMLTFVKDKILHVPISAGCSADILEPLKALAT